MKKVIWIAVFMLLAAVPVFAQEADSEKVKTFLDFRNDIVSSDKSGGQTIQAGTLWWQYKALGGVLEPELRTKNHYERMKASLLWKFGQSWYILGGATADSQGSDFVQAGVWYVGNLGKFKVLLDARNYFSISGQSNGYTDDLLRIMYPITNKLSVGTDIAFDHWWGDGHNLYFVGPRISYQISKNISIYARVSHEWNVSAAGTEETDRIRVGLAITF
jgi:hypothetical protein